MGKVKQKRRRRGCVGGDDLSGEADFRVSLLGCRACGGNAGGGCAKKGRDSGGQERLGELLVGSHSPGPRGRGRRVVAAYYRFDDERRINREETKITLVSAERR